eukprot:g16889.t1
MVYNKDLLRSFTNEAALDISPYSAPELCKWADVLARLNYEDEKLLSVLARSTGWKAESMSASQLNTVLGCLGHFHFDIPSSSMKAVAGSLQRARAPSPLFCAPPHGVV